MNPDSLPSSPACQRNRQPILKVIREWLPEKARILEIGAGTGEHAVHFARHLPGLEWQVSDVAENLPDLAARLALQAPQLPGPIELDVTGDWPDGPFDAVYTANTLHIMPWPHTSVLMERTATRLVEGGMLIIYGPFHHGGKHVSDSNRRFDASLKQRDPAMGVRDALTVGRLAAENGLEQVAEIDMPANNRILIFSRTTTHSGP